MITNSDLEDLVDAFDRLAQCHAEREVQEREGVREFGSEFTVSYSQVKQARERLREQLQNIFQRALEA